MSGFNKVIDQVVRRQQFEAQHPAVEISHHEQPWYWSAVYYDADQRKEVTRTELGDLLNCLDALLG